MPDAIADKPLRQSQGDRKTRSLDCMRRGSRPRPAIATRDVCQQQGRNRLIRLSHSLDRIRHTSLNSLRRMSRPAVLGTVTLTTVLAVAGCGASSAGSGSAGSGSGSGSGTSQSSTLKKCLEQHGVTLPQGRPSGGATGGGSGTPRARPTGSTASSFRQALQACGGSFGSHTGSAG